MSRICCDRGGFLSVHALPYIAKMHRSITRCPLQFVGEIFSGSLAHKLGKKNVAASVELFQTVAGTEDLASFVYGGESRSLAFQIVNALRWGDRTKASNLLSSYTAGSHALNKDDFVLIFDYCARSSDPLFVMEMWRILEEKSIAVGDKCYLLIVRALCHGGYLEEAFRLVKFLRESHQISCILPLYNYFLSACVKMQSLMHVNQCLDLMDYQMVGKNEITYTALLKLAVWQQNLSAVRGIWKQYIKYYNINIISLRKFIWSFTRLKDLESAYETLQHMVALAFKEGTSLKRTPEGKLCCPRLDIPIPSDNDIDMKRYNMNSIEHLATSIFDEEMNTQASVALQHAGFDAECGESRTFGVNMLKGNKSMLINKVLRWSFNDVIHACAQTQNSWLAEQLILQMQTLGLEPSCHTYDGFIRAIISEKGFGDGMKVLRIMEKSNLKPYESTVATLSIGCSRGFDLDLAEDLLDQISESPCAYPYNVFLEACDTMDQPERAVRMLAKMIRLKVKMDIKTYELLFSLFGNVNAPYEEGNMLSQVDAAKRINAIEMDMLRNGIQHSQLSIKNLLRALGSEGMIRELIQYLRIAENQFSHNTFLEADIYNTVLHSLVEAKESHMAIEIFRNMKLCGFWPDAATYNIMIDCCSNIRSFKSACALVSMMVRDGFYPQTLTYTSLIKILLECDDFDEALNLLDQAISEGNQPDVLLFNTILNKAYLQGRIDVIELTIERMHEEKIQPDSSTCNYVFSAYADRELFSTAVEALQVLSMRMISENDSALEEKRMEFEEFIQAEDPEAEMRIMHTFSHSEDLAAALFNLRWCAMIGFSISWPPNHSLWARRLVRTYGTQKRVA